MTAAQRADDQRTRRLLNRLETAYAHRTGGQPDSDDLDEFERVLVEGLASDKTQTPWPPTGHTYPKP